MSVRPKVPASRGCPPLYPPTPPLIAPRQNTVATSLHEEEGTMRQGEKGEKVSHGEVMFLLAFYWD